MMMMVMMIMMIMILTLVRSGLISLIATGLAQRRYAFPNLSPSSATTVVSFIKSVGVTCEVLIFVLLGNSITKRDGWDWQFVLITFLLCHLARAMVVISLSLVLNCFRYNHIPFSWQMVLWVGGLRGAIAYTMAISYEGPFRDEFIDTTIVIIFSTVILNGVAAGPLVQRLGLNEREEEEEEEGTPEVKAETGRYTEFEERYLLPALQRPASLTEKVVLSRASSLVIQSQMVESRHAINNELTNTSMPKDSMRDTSMSRDSMRGARDESI